jgi:hypothetical protein
MLVFGLPFALLLFLDVFYGMMDALRQAYV